MDQYETPPKAFGHTGLVVIPCDQVPINVAIGVVRVDGVRTMGDLKAAEDPVVGFHMKYATVGAGYARVKLARRAMLLSASCLGGRGAIGCAH